jgi:mannose-6-phosphate isomerase-like protein (cupin superfamily)
MSVRVRRLSEEPGIEETEEGFIGVNTIWAVLKRTDLTGFSSRIFRMEPRGHTATLIHPLEQVAVVVSGVCRVEGIPDPVTVSSGSIITIPPNVSHKFFNPGRDRLVLLIMNMFTESDAPEAEPVKEGSEGEPATSE